LVASVRVWLDILTPKQANMLGLLAGRLSSAGVEVGITARRYRELTQLLRIRGIRAKPFGEHGGGDLYSKLVASAERTLMLAKFAKRFAPDLAVSFSSPECARASFGLGVGHYCISDSPHAVAVSKLTVPISEKLFSPRAIPKAAWERYGIARDSIIQYDALDPVAWIRAYSPRREPEEGLVVFRPEEARASYLLKGESDTGFAREFLRRLLEIEAGARVVIVPRYDPGELSGLGRAFRNASVLRSAVDGMELLGRASAFVGRGGTMTAEAALMGVPSISCYPSDPTFVERYLIRAGLVKRIPDPRRAAEATARILRDPSYRARASGIASGLLSKMEDPIEVIARGILGG
jgi:predicted glycosyltransferase